jgi:adenylate cyclase
LGCGKTRGRLGGFRRLSACADAAGDAHRADPDQGPDRDDCNSRGQAFDHHTVDPDAVEHLWHGRVKPEDLYSILIPFILFELWVHISISRYLQLGRDLPVYRRHLGTLIETSMPTLALAMEIDSMGPVEALGFVAPLVYFIFIILSTLRLDFWLSTFTGFVAAAELFYMAMFYHRAGSAAPAPDLYYHSVRSVMLLICGMLAGAVAEQLRRQFAASIMAATARDRVTNCSASTSRPG